MSENHENHELTHKDFLLETRLSAVQESIKRSRYAILLSIVAALASLVCLSNTFLSVDLWDSFRLTLPPKCDNRGASPGSGVFCYDSNEKGANPAFSISEEMYKRLIENWMDSTYIDIPVMGTRVSVMDLAFYNSCAMLLFTLYLLLSQRRENREIAYLLRDIHNKRQGLPHDSEARRTVYRGIMASMVFILPTKDDEGIRELSDEHDLPFDKRRSIRGVRKLVRVVAFLPCISIFFSFLLHMYLIFGTGFVNWAVTRLKEIETISELFELSALLYVIYLTKFVLKYHRDTCEILNEFYESLPESGGGHKKSREVILDAPLPEE
jgi:hypothetical protein